MNLAPAPRLIAALLAFCSLAGSFPAVAADWPSSGRICGYIFSIDDSGTRVSVPLESTEVLLDVKPGLLEAQVTQTFTNRTDKALEATYLYPLPAGATLTDFELRYRDRVVRSQVREKAVARAIYDAAKAEGRKTSLLEQRDPSLFSTAVANFLPGESVQVVIRFIQPLDFSSGAIEARFPMVTSDKYFPADASSASVGNSAANPERRSAALVAPNHVYSFDIQVTGIPVQMVESSSHRIKFTRPDPKSERVLVSLQDEIAIPDRDFVLRIEPRAGAALQPTLVTQRTGTGDYGMLTIFPPQKRAATAKAAPGRDVLFLLDRSGSMWGERFKSAKIGLATCLAALAPVDRFHIVIFDDKFDFYRPAWTQATAPGLEEARAYVGGLEVRGGTVMQPALAASLDAFEPGERNQILIFLTDGDVGNSASLLNLLETKIGQVRLFPFGIGAAPHAMLIKQMAEAGRGQARFIADDTAIARELVDLFETLDAPVLSQVRLNLLDAQGRALAHAAFPERLPDVFVGRPIQAVFRLQSGTPAAVTVEGVEDDRPVVHRLALQSSPLRGSGLEKQFGKKLFDDLGMMLRRATNDAERGLVREEMLATALQFQLVTELTSRVAVSDEIARDPNAKLVTEHVMQYQVADNRAAGGYVASATLSGARVTDPDVVTLTTFEVSAESDVGYMASNTLSGTRMVRGDEILDLQEDRAYCASRALEDEVLLTTETQQTTVRSMLGGLPISTLVDPATIERIILQATGTPRGDIFQQRVRRLTPSALTLRVGDEGFTAATARISFNLPGRERLPMLALLSWSNDRQRQASIFLQGEKTLGPTHLQAIAQARELEGYGSMRLVRGSFERTFGDRLRVEATVVGHGLKRKDPAQFRLAAAEPSYEGLGVFNLDLLTAETRRLEDALAQVRFSGLAMSGGIAHHWSATARWHRQEAAWLAPRAADAIAMQRDNAGVALGYHSAWLHDRLHVEVHGGATQHRTSQTTVGREATQDAGIEASWESDKNTAVFVRWAREAELPWLSTGRWQARGAADLVAVAPPPEIRAGGQLGLRVKSPGTRLGGTFALFHETVHQHTYREWSWERSQTPAALASPIAGELRSAVSMRAWPDFVRQGFTSTVNFTPSRLLSLHASWSEEWKDAGPYRGGNRRASLSGQYSFRGGALDGLATGFTLYARNALVFDDGYTLPGGLRADMRVRYQLGARGNQATLLQLSLANIAGRPWQATRFAPDHGRQVLLSVTREF